MMYMFYCTCCIVQVAYHTLYDITFISAHVVQRSIKLHVALHSMYNVRVVFCLWHSVTCIVHVVCCSSCIVHVV